MNRASWRGSVIYATSFVSRLIAPCCQRKFDTDASIALLNNGYAAPTHNYF